MFTQDRTQMLEITHTYTPQTTTYTLRMEQPLMMVLTLNCKYYKENYLLYSNGNICLSIQIPKIDALLQTICKQCPLAFKLFCFVVDFTSILSIYTHYYEHYDI